MLTSILLLFGSIALLVFGFRLFVKADARGVTQNIGINLMLYFWGEVLGVISLGGLLCSIGLFVAAQ